MIVDGSKSKSDVELTEVETVDENVAEETQGLLREPGGSSSASSSGSLAVVVDALKSKAMSKPKPPLNRVESLEYETETEGLLEGPASPSSPKETEVQV